MTRQGLARLSSSESTLSCITLENKDQFTSAASLSTPPTSLTDAISISSTSTIRNGESRNTNRRASRIRTAVPSYNENALSRTSRKASTSRKCRDAVRAGSRETLIPNSEDAQKQLVQDCIQVLDIEWSVDSMPGDKMGHNLPANTTSRQAARSTKLLRRATNAVEQTKSVSGKRRRDVIEVAGRLHELGRQTNLRPRRLTLTSKETLGSPQKKKPRLVDVVEEKDPGSKNDPALKSTESVRRKQWLSQGLYVGQDPDFDPRLSDAKNKMKRASRGAQPTTRRKLLPMPRFAGNRVLEQGRNFRLPWDVFSPLPPGQPKPEEWRKTQKNVFVGDAADIWKTSKKLEHSTCICTKDSGCDENCFNRFMFYECDDGNCNIGSECCRNRSFEDLRKRCRAGGKYNIGVEVIKTADRGYGVRSNRTFEPNQIIVEYTGEIITQDECDDRMKKRYKNNECFYLMIFDQNMIIDATRGSIARFVNHSCEPNCKMVKWTVAGKPRMALFAGETGIMTGEELTYDYNFDPFSSKNIQECHCGTPSCRGILGPKPKEREIKDALKPLIQVGTKRKFQRVMEDTGQSVSKRRRILMPKSIKAAARDLKTKGSTQIAKAKILASTGLQNTRLVKRVSERSFRETRRSQAKKRTSTVTLTRLRKGGSTHKVQSGSSETLFGTERSMVESVVSMRRNVMRSVRGAKRDSHLGTSAKAVEP